MALKTKEIHETDLDDTVYQLLEYVHKGVSLKDIEGVSDGEMDEIYACAYHFYNERKLDEAESLFKLLCMYDLENANYVIGLGAVHQFRKNYQKACDFYALAYVMAENDFLPMIYGGQCQLLMGNVGRALQCFDTVVNKCDDKKLQDKANVYIKLIKENRNDSDVNK